MLQISTHLSEYMVIL